MAKTPLMDQYKKVKEKYQDSLLFYRLGDFYELFYDDAMTASHELELTLTGKNAGAEGRVPMFHFMQQRYIFIGLYKKDIRLLFASSQKIRKKQRDL